MYNRRIKRRNVSATTVIPWNLIYSILKWNYVAINLADLVHIVHCSVWTTKLINLIYHFE